MFNIKEVNGKPRLHASVNLLLEDGRILRDFVVAAAVVRTRPRAIPLAMITMKKSIHEFPSVFYMGMGLRLADLPGAPLI